MQFKNTAVGLSLITSQTYFTSDSIMRLSLGAALSVVPVRLPSVRPPCASDFSK